MKNNKKLWIAAIAVFIAIFSAVPTFAAPDLSGRDPSLPTSLTIHHRTLPEGTTTPGSPSNPTLPSPAGMPIVGSRWNVVQVNLPSGFDWTDHEAIENIPSTWTTGPLFTQLTNASGEAHFSGLPQGIFVVLEQESEVTTEEEAHRPFLVELPLFFDGQWNYDVHVYPKQETEAPLFNKDLVEVDGNVVTWGFSVSIMSNLGTLLPIEGSTPSSFIRIVDMLDPRLDFMEDSIRVDFETATGVFESLPQSGNWAYTWDGATNTLTTNILQGGRDAIAERGMVGGSIRTTFDTTIGDLTLGLGPIYNTGTLYYGPLPGVENDEEPGDQTPSVTLFGLDLFKINTRNLPLEGAVFHLYTQNSIEEIGGNLQVMEDASPFAVLTSDEDGFAYLRGLTAGTYLLVEDTPPAGYNRFTSPITLVINTTTANSSYIVEATITNSSGFELPLTGGAGTLIFTIAGLALIGGSIFFIFFYTRRRRREEEQAS